MFGKGYSPEDYTLFSYGGGGPMHVTGYTKGLNFADVLIPAWAAGFPPLAAPAQILKDGKMMWNEMVKANCSLERSSAVISIAASSQRQRFVAT